jgi:4-oxalocrotonate tautomerase
MPIIQVNLLEGRTVEQKRALIGALTEAAVSALGVRRESVRILINELDREHFAVGGRTVGEGAVLSSGVGVAGNPLNGQELHP